MSTEKETGVYEKYEVRRKYDPFQKHEYCNYFVLDLVHDKFAGPALQAYAKACESEYPKLADHLRYLAEPCPTCKNEHHEVCSDAHHYIPAGIPSGELK